jgi:SAM-dependent methyltransferase
VLPSDHFDEAFAEGRDPWGYGEVWYERRRHQLTMASLPLERYQRVFEPGCAFGALTVLLAARCHWVLAVDMAEEAVRGTRQATQGLTGVRVRRMRVPESWPLGSFDLVVLSDLAYYVSPEVLGTLLERTAASLEVGGHLVAAHGRRVGADFLFPGGADAVHRTIHRHPAWHRVVRHRERALVVDVFERR